MCNWKEDFIFPLDMTLICLDPSPGSSSVQITHVAILKCFDNLFLVSLEEMNLFQCCCSKFLLFGAFICQSLLCSKLVWGRTKPCSCCYEFSVFVRKFKLVVFLDSELWAKRNLQLSQADVI